MPRKVTPQPERMRIAAQYRFAHPDVTWEEIATHVGIDRHTLWLWRRTEQYEIISREVAQQYVADLAPDALAGLRRAWKKGNPAGALDVLRALALLNGQELKVLLVEPEQAGAEIAEMQRQWLERRKAS